MNYGHFLTINGTPIIVGQTREYKFALDSNVEVLSYLAINHIQEVVVLFRRFDNLWSEEILDYYQDQGILVHIKDIRLESDGENPPCYVVQMTGLIRITPVRFIDSIVYQKPLLQFLYNTESVYSADELRLANQLLKSFLLSNYHALPERIRAIVRVGVAESEEPNYVVELAEELELVEEDYNDFYHHFDLLEQALFLIEHYRNDEDDHDASLEKHIRDVLEDQHKRYVIMEKIRVLQKLLGEEADEDSDPVEAIDEDPLELIRIPQSVRRVIKAEHRRIKSLFNSSPEANVGKTYVDNLIRLPWRLCDAEQLDISRVSKILERDHFGLENVKERIIHFLSSRIYQDLHMRGAGSRYRANEVRSIDGKTVDLSLFIEDASVNITSQSSPVPIITLVGPPGVGKTSLVRSIAEALGRKYIKISLGGSRDESDIRGHRRTYVSAMPGKIIKAILSAGVSNPVILLDEIDKIVTHSHQGDVSSALLEVLDPEQNRRFQDNYLELEYDLSRVLFIATANYIEQIPAALRDRVEIIELNTYTLREKIEIARRHIIPRTLRGHGLPTSLINLTDSELTYIIEGYTYEAGVRALQRCFTHVCQRAISDFLNHQPGGTAARDLQESQDKISAITYEQICEYLRAPKFRRDMLVEEQRIGRVNGLAYTPLGGTILPIEVITYPAKESSGLTITGLAAQVMQESAAIAHGFVKGNASMFGIEDFEFNQHQVHFHVPEGATPKDGPSAGVTFVTSLISYISKIPVSTKIAMTGEVTLQGHILQIGGLREKTLAAQMNGITKVFIPKQNEPDIKQLPQEVLDNITFIPVSHYREIYQHLFLDKRPITTVPDAASDAVQH